MADVTVEFGATDTGLDKTLQGIRDSMKNLETQQKTTAMSTDEVERSLRELKKLQGMEKHFMDLSGETAKLSESQMEAKRASEELAAAMKKAEEETRTLAEEQKKAESITKANRTATEIYNQEIEELQKHLAAGRISMETFTAATTKADQRLSAATPQAKDLGSQIENVGDKTKKVGGIFDDEFKRMGAAFTVGNLAAEGFQKAISLAFDAARAVVRGFSDALDLGGRLSELSTRTGEAAGTLLVLETAFKNSGLEASQVGQVINKLQNFMQDAANGGEKQTKAMSDLGISMADLAGKTPTEQMEVFAKKIAAIEDPTQRAATASEVFGEKLGGKLLPLLVDFSGNIEDAKSKVGSLEQVMNENADTFDKFSESIEAVKGKMAAFSAGVLSETVPALQELGSEMEGMDATGLGQVIGQTLNPAITDLTKNITLASDILGILKKAASDAGSGLKYHSEQFKEGATQANKYLQVIAALLPGGLNPLGLGLKAVANVSNEATNEMNGVATAASDAQPALAELGDKATQAGDKVNTAFTLTADLKPELDSIGSGWGDISDKIQTGNSLLEGTGTAFGAIAQSTEQQVAGIGGVNDQLTVSQNLNKLILDLAGKTADKGAQKAADQEKANALKQAELKYQLELAEAQAAGDTERVDALTEQKKYAEDIQKALAAGFGEGDATKMANEMARAAREADRMQKSPAMKIGTDIKARQESEAIDPGGKLMEKAQEQISKGAYAAAEATGAQIKTREQEAMIRGVGSGTDRRALSDIAKDYGLDTMGKTSTQLRDELYKIRTEGQGTSDKTKKGLETTQKRMGEGMQKEGKAKSAEKDKPMKLDEMVNSILKLIEKIEPKLPTAALST